MSEIMRQLPKYKCHKEVWALKIKDMFPNSNTAAGGWELSFEDEGYAPILMSYQWCNKHNPKEGGYYVVYEDGYKSYSPADAFESGYSKI